jgi:hypothetical protein
MFEEDPKMTASAASQKHDFHSLLAAPGRSPEISEENDVYGWLIGSWDLEVLQYAAVDVAPLHIQGEVHFGWVLEGRAIQDVWIMPRVSERSANLADANKKTNNMYGTTLRIWDASIQAWRIRWFNPVTNHYEQQIGRRVGNDIVQVGARVDGTATRWRFTEITPNSFRWLGESLSPDGAAWKLEGEFRATRSR